MKLFEVTANLKHRTLKPLAQGNPRVSYKLVFQAAAETLQAFGRDAKWLAGQIGITMVRHTWGQNLNTTLAGWCAMWLARIDEVFPLPCPRYGEPMGLIDFITHSGSITRIRVYLGQPTEAPHIALAAHGPPWEEDYARR